VPAYRLTHAQAAVLLGVHEITVSKWVSRAGCRRSAGTRRGTCCAPTWSGFRQPGGVPGSVVADR